MNETWPALLFSQTPNKYSCVSPWQQPMSTAVSILDSSKNSLVSSEKAAPYSSCRPPQSVQLGFHT